MTTSEGPSVTQPRIPFHYRLKLDAAGLAASCYQPTFLFLKNGRKLPNCAEPSDPWQVFLRRNNGQFGVVGEGIGATLEDALEIALRHRQGLGLLRSMSILGSQLDLLSEAINARQN
jgi:hypothetical protein